MLRGHYLGHQHGGAQGAAIGAGVSAVGEVLNFFNAFDKAKLLPNQVSGSNTGDVNWASGGNNFVFKRCHAKIEYLQIADNFFTRFGYKINRVKTPNITGRAYFNYVEVASSDDPCSGSIPEKYLDEIIKAFRRGITIWHDASKIGDYTVSNTIL